MQWKQMNWPVLWDPLNLLELKAVPHTILIDERGVVVNLRPRPEDLDAFLELPARSEVPQAATRPNPQTLRSTQPSDARAARHLADALVLWGTDEDLDRAIELYARGLDDERLAAVNHFRMGVAHRRRYDSPARQVGDFAAAVSHWSRALALDPNQYIWRRRIQQYGPTLDKPYPFYNWVETARQAIRIRGEVPVELTVEPQGAELAAPAKRFTPGPPAAPPASSRRLAEDKRGLVTFDVTVVPDTNRSDPPAWAVHLEYRPNSARQSHWNNEADPMIVWIEPSPSCEVDRPLQRLTPPPQPTSDEPRNVQFQIQQANSAAAVVTGFALYGVCTDDDGTCRYLRQDFRIPLVAP